MTLHLFNLKELIIITYPNLNKALIALKYRTDIIIKPADKGSSVVVMDRDQYILLSEDERQLNDNTYYQLLDHDPTTECAIQVAETVKKCMAKVIFQKKIWNVS